MHIQFCVCRIRDGKEEGGSAIYCPKDRQWSVLWEANYYEFSRSINPKIVTDNLLEGVSYAE